MASMTSVFEYDVLASQKSRGERVEHAVAVQDEDLGT